MSYTGFTLVFISIRPIIIILLDYNPILCDLSIFFLLQFSLHLLQPELSEMHFKVKVEVFIHFF